MGQSADPRHRLAQHIKCILQGDCDTLHYYIISKGNGHRSANFLRLWTLQFPGIVDASALIVVSNILEMVMTGQFQSLSSSTLEKYFDVLDNGLAYSALGLNVIPPVLQGVSLGPTLRQAYSLQLEKSPDPQIRGWPEFRGKQRISSARTSSFIPKPSMSWEDYLAELHRAMDATPVAQRLRLFDPASSAAPTENLIVDTWLNRLRSDITNATGECGKLVPPVGTFNAQIGIVLDHGSIDTGTGDYFTLPWGIRECGFTEKNSMIWPYNFRQHILVNGLQDTKPLRTDETNVLKQYNRELIHGSSIRVVLLFGKSSSDILTPAEVRRIECEVRGCTIVCLLETDGDEVSRLQCSSPLIALWANNWPQAQKISELFLFAAAITHTSRIHSCYSASTLVCTRLIWLYDGERQGGAKMTLETLEPNVREWLFRRGFTSDEDIRRLEKFGDSLVHSLLMIMCLLPSCPPEFKGSQHKRLVMDSKTRPSGKYDMNEIRRVGDLYLELNQEQATLGPTVSQLPSGLTSEPEPRAITGAYNELEGILVASMRDGEERGKIFKDEKGNHQMATNHASGKFSTSLLSPQELATQESLLRGRWYKGHRLDNGFYRILLHSTLILIVPLPENYKTGVTVKAIITPPGEINPNAWARKARADEPASRLAFLVTATNEDEEIFTYFPYSESETRPYVANTFVDWMAGETVEAICKKPRRHAMVPAHTVKVADGMRDFLGSNLIDGDGNRVVKKPRGKKRRWSG